MGGIENEAGNFARSPRKMNMPTIWVRSFPDTSDDTVAESVMCRTLTDLVRQRQFSSVNDSVLAVFAGDFDRTVFRKLGFDNTTFTNMSSTVAAPVDAMRMPYADRSFQHVIAHAGIHHASRPHQSVCEMYRVASDSVIFFEAQDSLLMRLAVKAGLTVEYEWNAILDHGMRRGGVDDLPIPNHVYRWTRREVLKLVRSLDPAHIPDVEFFTEWDFGYKRIARRLQRTPIGVIPAPVLEIACSVVIKLFNLLFRHWGNSFVCRIGKSKTDQPWMQDGRFLPPGGIIVTEVQKDTEQS